MNTVLAWHFTGETLRGGSPIPPIGQPLEVEGELKMCEWGLHASIHPWDALKYANGTRLHRVECSGKMILGDDKLVCSRRIILASNNVELLLRRFAKDQALSVIHLWSPPQIVQDYLRGDDESLRAAAGAAAWDAARAAAGTAAWDAARYAAWEAAAWDAAKEEFKVRVEQLFGIGGGK